MECSWIQKRVKKFEAIVPVEDFIRPRRHSTGKRWYCCYWRLKWEENVQITLRTENVKHPGREWRPLRAPVLTTLTRKNSA